jgi:Mrp family chromosome partitioning ATPase
VSDSLSIAKYVQSVLVTYRIGKTPRRALFRALKYLDANHTSPSGLIANQLPAAKNRRAYGYYYSFSGGGGYEGAYGGYGSDSDDAESEPEEILPFIDVPGKTVEKEKQDSFSIPGWPPR